MKYCAKCGKELMDEAIICPNCGCATGQITGQKDEFNWMALVGFICSFFVAIVGLVFGILGLQKSKELLGEKGKNFAIAAIAISCVTLFLNFIEILLYIFY